ALTAASTLHAVERRPWTFLAFLALTFVLQVVSIEVPRRGSYSFAGAGLLALGFTLGVGPAMCVGALMGIVNLLARRRHGARVNRGVFDAAQFSLSAGAGTGFFYALGAQHWSAEASVLPAVGAAAAWMVVNVGLLSLALSLASGETQ